MIALFAATESNSGCANGFADFAPAMVEDYKELERRCIAVLVRAGGDVAHDREHVRRVVGNARRLAQIEGARLTVVLPAAWLHDCVLVPKDSPERNRASGMAAAQAIRCLREWGWSEILLPEISHAIEAHSFSAGILPQTVEAKVVQDADRLDAIGAVGLARCLMLGGAMARPLYATNDPFCDRRTADDAVSAVDHCYTKLLKIEGLMQTDSGRREAQRRTVFLRRYLDELREEIGDGSG